MEVNAITVYLEAILMNESKVAVCLTSYNRADLIKETLDGLKNQTLKDFHIYLCWDGSTDNTFEVIQDYSKDLPITLCPYNITTSVGSAKHKAVKEALKNNHKYLQILDSDDIPLPAMLEENSKRLDQGDVDWVICWSGAFGASQGHVRSEIKSFEEQCNKNYLHSWVMAKATVFEKENFRLDLNGIDDWDWWIRVFKAGFKGTVLEKELHKYRVHKGRVSEETGSLSKFPELRKKVRMLNDIDKQQFTFHLISLVHLPQHTKYNSCAFTQKNLKLAKMLTSLGHIVYFYGSEGSNVEQYVNSDRLHFVQTHTLSDIRKAWGDGDNRFEIGYDWTGTDFRHDFNTEKTAATKKFYANCISEIRKNSQPDHFLLLTMGAYHNPIADELKLFLRCEPGIGYRGSSPKNWRAFESSYIQNFTYGSANPFQSINGSYYDRVIPNYWDGKDFQFNPEPGKYLLYMGRMIKRKGIMTADLVSRATGIPLKIAGQGGIVLPNGTLEATTNSDISIPKGNWEYVGFADVEKRKELMSNALVTFVATEYLECFGGVNCESRLSGTPVLTTNFAVFPELIINGVDGYRCDTLDDFVWGTEQCKTIDRNIVRKRAERYLIDNVQWEFQKWFEDLYQVYLSTLGTGIKGWHHIRKVQPEWRNKLLC